MSKNNKNYQENSDADWNDMHDEETNIRVGIKLKSKNYKKPKYKKIWEDDLD